MTPDGPPDSAVESPPVASFAVLLAVIGTLSKPARADALSRAEAAGLEKATLARLAVCLGVGAQFTEFQKELTPQLRSIPIMNSKSDNPNPTPESGATPTIVFDKEVHGAVFNFGPQQGIVSTGNHAENTQIVRRPAGSAPTGAPAPAPPPPDFRSEQELAAFLQGWVRDQWKTGPTAGTGRSGNVLLPARWQGQPALLKISADAGVLRAEAAHLEELHDLGVGLCVSRLLAVAEVVEDDDRWMGYLMERVGEMSLRDYLFTPTPSPRKFLANLGTGLSALYCRTARPTTRDFVAEYLNAIQGSVDKARGYAPFAGLAAYFDKSLQIKGRTVPGPGAILSGLLARLKTGDASLRGVNPACECRIHGDLHFENLRINPADAGLGLHWLIDPKDFHSGDYVYDLAKLLTSLTGHAHADIGEQEKGNPRLDWTRDSPGAIDFNCILTPRQADGWREGLAAIEALAREVAPWLEEKGGCAEAGDDAAAVLRMRQRLLLALARHFFSAVRFFFRPQAQWMLFARGTQFLALFQAALDGASVQDWDPFRVCAGEAWLEEA